ncbi:hypothetical protein [Streptomyces parvulus]|uniref:hypothetical protein n=1 Tax=Streptomyces parvulus TaxID=146923 RepID=UPI0036C3849F
MRSYSWRPADEKSQIRALQWSLLVLRMVKAADRIPDLVGLNGSRIFEPAL